MTKFTVKQKILMVGFAWSVVTLALGLIIFTNMERHLAIQTSLEDAKKQVQKFNNLLTIMVDMETGIRGYLLSGEDSYLEPFNAAEGLFDQEARELTILVEKTPELKERVNQLVATKKEWIEGPAVEEMMLRRKFSRGMIDYAAFIQGFKASKGKVLTDRIRILVREAIAFEGEHAEKLIKEQLERSQMSKRSATYGILLAVLIGMSLLTFTVAALNKQMRFVVDALLDQVASLRTLSTNLSQSSNSLSDANKETAHSLEKTASAITQIASMTSSNSDLAHKTQLTADECNETARQGVDVVQRMIQTMNQTTEASQTMRKQFETNQAKLNEIVSRIKEISTKTQVINDIVFQTKLLSFNASVEAARAGEHGKGFAVVAEEVGNLANMSGKASKEISDLLLANESVITQTVTETSRTLEELVQGIVTRVGEGTARSRECEAAFNDIRQKIQGIQSLTREISAASEEQSKGVTEVSNVMQQIDGSAKSNLEMASNSLEFANSLSQASAGLQENVDGLFRLFERKPVPPAGESPAQDHDPMEVADKHRHAKAS